MSHFTLTPIPSPALRERGAAASRACHAGATHRAAPPLTAEVGALRGSCLMECGSQTAARHKMFVAFVTFRGYSLNPRSGFDNPHPQPLSL